MPTLRITGFGGFRSGTDEIAPRLQYVGCRVAKPATAAARGDGWRAAVCRGSRAVLRLAAGIGACSEAARPNPGIPPFAPLWFLVVWVAPGPSHCDCGLAAPDSMTLAGWAFSCYGLFGHVWPVGYCTKEIPLNLGSTSLFFSHTLFDWRPKLGGPSADPSPGRPRATVSRACEYVAQQRGFSIDIGEEACSEGAGSRKGEQG